jgi:hypothetical protein
MRLNTLLLAGIFFLGIIVSTQADVLDHWSTNQITTNGYKMDSIAYGNGCYVATSELIGGDQGEIYASVDGENWTPVYFNGGDNGIWGLNLHYVSGCFVGTTGGYGQVATSLDGTNWTISQVPAPLNFSPGDASSSDSLYVVVGAENGTGVAFYSSDGTNWTAASISPSVGAGISSAAYGTPRGTPPRPLAPIFVAVGNNGDEYISYNNGISWTRRSIPGGSQVSYGNGLFIVPLNSQNNLVSADGINWTQYSTGLTNQLGWIIYAHGVFISQSGSYLATSSDGINWFQYPHPLPGATSQYETLATDGNRIATLGSVYVGFDGFADQYDGYVYLSDPLVGVRMTNNPASQVALSGLVGRNYQIQSANVLTTSSNNWSTNLTIQLTNTPYVWTDSTATNSARFYRGVLLP